MFYPCTIPDLVHLADSSHTVNSDSREQLRDLINAIPGAPQIGSGDEVAIVIRRPCAVELSREQQEVDAACDNMIDAIVEWRRRGNLLHETALILTAVQQIEQESLKAQEIAFVRARRRQPLPQDQHRGVRCPCCGQAEYALGIVSARCNRGDGVVLDYTNVHFAGKAHAVQASCPSCKSIFPLSAAHAVHLMEQTRRDGN